MAPPPPFKLSRTLSGHSSDVRAVASPSDSLIASASRDGTVRSWTIPKQATVSPIFRNAPQPSAELLPDVSVFSQHSGYVNSLAYHPDGGYIVSGGQDKLIYVHKPGDTQPSHVLIGHENNVCALHVAEDGTLISGSWDNTARVWKNWECVYTLKGHDRAVWAVLALKGDEYLTASADQTIRLWKGDKMLRSFKRHTDVVRTLCEIPHLGFASAGNDAVIYVWTLEGEKLLELHSHTNFIYSLSVLPITGEIVSAGEDRSVKVWKDGECIQTITLPAISIWSCSTQPNGDIVVGSSDGEVRVFTREKTRFASDADLKEFEQKVASSAIPQQSLGDINKEKLPGLAALRQRGKKDGQVIMVKNGASVEAHQWSAATESWTKIGDVVNAVSQSQKQTYEGIEYDYVFDVDVQEGAPPLKLPYNVSENPYAAAQRFLEKNGLEMGYIDQVVKFIEQNTGGVQLGTGSGAVDPYCISPQPLPPQCVLVDDAASSRYIPGTASGYAPDPTLSPPKPAPPTQASTRKHIPHKSYLSFKQGDMSMILNKLTLFNSDVPTEFALSPAQIASITALKSSFSHETFTPLLPSLVEMILTWPSPKRFPAIDIVRLAAVKLHADVCDMKRGELGVVDILVEGAEMQEGVMEGRKDVDVNSLLAVRALVNLFEGEEGKKLMVRDYAKALDAAKIAVARTSTKPLKVAFATLLLNYAVLFFGKSDSDHAIGLIDPAVKLIQDTSADSEAIFRGLVALGTALSIDNDEVRIAGAQVFGVKEALQTIKKAASENRIKQVISEIEGFFS